MSEKRFICDSENGVEVVTRPADTGFVTMIHHSHIAEIDGLEFATSENHKRQHINACKLAGIRPRSLENLRRRR